VAAKALEEVRSAARCSQDMRSHEPMCMADSNERAGRRARVVVILRAQNGWSIETACVSRRVK
jgi:hypothetical protein